MKPVSHAAGTYLMMTYPNLAAAIHVGFEKGYTAEKMSTAIVNIIKQSNLSIKEKEIKILIKILIDRVKWEVLNAPKN